ncbi:MAG: hypothetical protein IJB96_02335 [Lachnospira sp.]|nr:hypothetical protein [Lachnospira sp.]
MKRKLSILLLITLMCALMLGCNSTGMNSVDNNESTEAVTKGRNTTYTINDDGTYTCLGKNFKYKLWLENVGDSIGYIVLSNKPDVTKEDIDKLMTSSTLNQEPEYICIGYDLGVKYTVNADGTYTYDGKTYKYKRELVSKGGTDIDISTVLTNNIDITYEDVAAGIGSADYVVIEEYE